MKKQNVIREEIEVYKTDRNELNIEVRVEDETIWLTQKQLSQLFQKDVRTINDHIKNVFKEGELEGNSVIRKYRITASDGKEYLTSFYNLDVIISVGYRVKSLQGTKFRIWATKVLREHLLKKKQIDAYKEKAANLLYLVIKNHPFIDGNKRIAAALFITYLAKNHFLYDNSGSKRIADNALVALCLMIAESNPKEKDTIVKVVINLINKNN